MTHDSAVPAFRGMERYSAAQWAENARRFRSRRRLMLLSGDAEDAISSLGGWMFDATAGGWEVTVLTRERGNERGLEILGVMALDLDALFDGPLCAVEPTVLAVSSQIYVSDQRIRTRVVDRLTTGRKRTVLWGPAPPAELGPMISDRHRVSRAGQVFKSHALDGPFTPRNTVIDDTETFWRDGTTPVLSTREL